MVKITPPQAPMACQKNLSPYNISDFLPLGGFHPPLKAIWKTQHM